MHVKPQIELLAVSKGVEHEMGPQDISAFGAFGCFEEQSALGLFKSTPADKRPKKVEVVLRESAGRGHGSVADQNCFTFSIENLTRAATLQLCLPHYLAHLQQSLRRATADRGFYLPDSIKDSSLFEDAKQTLSDSFKTYDKLSEKGVPKEDARFLLPLYTKTNIQTSGNARELMHLRMMNKQGEVPTAVSHVVDTMIAQASEKDPHLFNDWGYNYETLAWYPSAQFYSSENKTANEIIKKYKQPEATVYFEHEMSEDAVRKAVKERNET
ncbi:FAD-dependent thymidylate synthase, partial [Candidatus Micrarchaeota archaeon]|nr:FAD-dependent thymidylate synthase [Candidatus Micrarchaeota archaeon]